VKIDFKNYVGITLNEKITKAKAPAAKKSTATKTAPVKKTAPIVAAPAPAPAIVLKAPAKRAVAKKVAATVPATKAVAKKALAKKTVEKKAVAKKVVAKKAVAKKAVAKKVVAKKATAKALSTGKKPSTSGLPVRVKAVVNVLLEAVLKALEDMKAKDVVVIDVRNRTSITDDLVFASGTSTRHVKSLADSVAKAARDIKMPPIGVEGEKEAEWVLVDLADVVVHVMLPKTREFYALERLWSSAGDGTGE
jgi:ribosome-associated protein